MPETKRLAGNEYKASELEFTENKATIQIHLCLPPSRVTLLRIPSVTTGNPEKIANTASVACFVDVLLPLTEAF